MFHWEKDSSFVLRHWYLQNRTKLKVLHYVRYFYKFGNFCYTFQYIDTILNRRTYVKQIDEKYPIVLPKVHIVIYHHQFVKFLPKYNAVPYQVGQCCSQNEFQHFHWQKQTYWNILLFQTQLHYCQMITMYFHIPRCSMFDVKRVLLILITRKPHCINTMVISSWVVKRA